MLKAGIDVLQTAIANGLTEAEVEELDTAPTPRPAPRDLSFAGEASRLPADKTFTGRPMSFAEEALRGTR